MEVEAWSNKRGGSSISDICGNDVVDMILAALPIEAAIKCRLVCKEWDSLITSSYFTNAWKAQHRSYSPYLLFDMSCNPKNCVIYSLTCQKWFKISTSFLRFVSLKAVAVGSTDGLLLIQDSSRLIVCNPMRQTYVNIPPGPTFSPIFSSDDKVGIVSGKQRGSYKVFVLGREYHISPFPLLLQVYDSTRKSWHTTVEIPNTDSKYLSSDQNIVFSKGFFFSVLYNSSDKKYWMMYGNTEHINSNISEIELPHQRDPEDIYYHLASCDSSLIVVALIGQKKIDHLLMWEFEFDKRGSNSFRIINWMPSPIKNDPTSSFSCIWSYRCWGVGDLLCFGKHFSPKMLVYNLKECSWHRLRVCSGVCSGRRFECHGIQDAMVYDVAEGLSS